MMNKIDIITTGFLSRFKYSNYVDEHCDDDDEFITVQLDLAAAYECMTIADEDLY
jgi:hypothetical protein